MRDIFASYREAAGESRFTITKFRADSTDIGRAEFFFETHHMFGYLADGAIATHRDWSKGFVEYGSNNPSDLPGNSLKVALLAGAGSLALM